MVKSLLIRHEGARLERDVMVPWLGSFTDVCGIVVITRGRGRIAGKVRRQIRRVGLLRFADVLAFRVYYRMRLARADAAWEERYASALTARYGRLAGSPPTLRTHDVNSDEVADFIAQRAPDFTLARCSVLLDRRIFSLPRHGTFVVHPGIAPEYRNSHGCFWALANRDMEHVGATLLRIDEGVDTGDIYGYHSYDFDEVAESHVMIQKRVVYENLDALRGELLSITDGSARAVDTSGRRSASWGQPWLSAYLRWKRAARRPR